MPLREEERWLCDKGTTLGLRKPKFHSCSLSDFLGDLVPDTAGSHSEGPLVGRTVRKIPGCSSHHPWGDCVRAKRNCSPCALESPRSYYLRCTKRWGYVHTPPPFHIVYRAGLMQRGNKNVLHKDA